LKNKNLDLFLTFLKIGAFTFGGGYAMIPFITEEIVDKRKWLTDEEMIELVAIAESTPGVIAVNSATFVGYRITKFWGAFFSTLGVVLPSLIIIVIIAMFFENFLEIEVIANAFKGIRAGVAVLILNTGLKFLKQMNKTWISFFLMGLALVLSLLVEFQYLSTSLIVFGALVGIITQALVARKTKNKEVKEDNEGEDI
jgi:chromate transporter